MIRQVLRRTLRAGAQINGQRPVRSLFTQSRLAAAAMPSLQVQAGSKAAPLNFRMGGLLAAVTVAAGSVAYLDSPQQASPKVDYDKVRQQVARLVQEDDNRGPLFVRLAWHSSGTYDVKSKTGGSNGATMRYNPESNWGANSGLHHARELLEPIKRDHPGISYSDLWILAGVAAIEEMGGPKIDFRPGRKDATTMKACPPGGRLPDADKGSPSATLQHVRDVFYRMGFNDQEIVALIGAHTLGRCHVDRSGYHGPWTRAPTTFSNQFFVELLNNKWTKKNWEGPEQYEDPTGELMMLPADMVLLQDREFRKWVELYAKDEQAFFRDFAVAFKKLTELGVPFDNPMTVSASGAAPAPQAASSAAAPAKKKSWWIF